MATRIAVVKSSSSAFILKSALRTASLFTEKMKRVRNASSKGSAMEAKSHVAAAWCMRTASSWQIRTKIDTLLPSPAHTAQGKQAKEANKSQQSERQLPVTQVAVTYKVGDPCYALYFGPRRDRDPRWCLPLLSNVLGPTVSTCVWFREVQSGDAI